MNKKNMAIIGIIAVIIVLGVAIYFTFAASEESSKTLEFDKFSLSVPGGIDFKEESKDYELFNASEEGYYIAGIDSNTNSWLTVIAYETYLANSPQLNNSSGFNLTNNSKLTVYNLNDSKVKYVGIYEFNEMTIIIGAPSLENLKLMINSIKFKDINGTNSLEELYEKGVSEGMNSIG
ncbi:hypothetical protein LJB96_04200 [Methanobrevibacter sp. OttesenSCG-928-K11]|nr:hypothetical protein [Methanobrevibacter sp. OttesenSCG-928-K11]